MSSDSRRTCSFTLDSAEQKEALRLYAKSKGFRRLSDFLRVAMVEYITRRAPRKGMDVDITVRRVLEGKTAHQQVGGPILITVDHI